MEGNTTFAEYFPMFVSHQSAKLHHSPFKQAPKDRHDGGPHRRSAPKKDKGR